MNTDRQGNKQARIFQIQRMSTEDGPGIRTTVFFKGCSLACRWCHNPESISPAFQVTWTGSRCIGCLTCIDLCPNRALEAGKDGIRISRDKCAGCGTCVKECPGGALEMHGRLVGLDELVAEVIKDRAYFEASGGGVTASGGEPVLQAGFVSAFFKKLRGAGIDTALDTSGMCGFDALESILGHTVLVLFDLKIMDPEKHSLFTGKDNKRILENFRKTVTYIANHLYPREVWVRTPVIPGATDTVENIAAIGRFIRENGSGVVTRWDLLAFNDLCADKYMRLGMGWDFAGTGKITQDHLEYLADAAGRAAGDPGIVVASGATRLEEDNNAGKESKSGVPDSRS